MQEVFRLLGLWPISIIDNVKTMILVSILFAGPLFEAGIVDGGLKDWIRGRYLRETLTSWIGYRNYIVVGSSPFLSQNVQTNNTPQGPVSEELIWRAMIIPLHILAHFSGKQIIFLTPLYFGIAHVHHMYDFRITHPHAPFIVAVARSLFQFTYTSLFGFFAAFVFLRTGNMLSVILAHSFCNWMGLPRLWGRVGIEAGMPIGPPVTGKTSDANGALHNYRHDGSKGIAWTVAYYCILVAGAYGFYRGLFPLTDSRSALPVGLAGK
jgi:prenyl protein peptidase